jgi:membrane-bound lytic murein transglycosylase D
MTYIMNYYKKHNIEPLPCSFSIKTDTLLVNKYVSLGNISQALGLELKDMAILNPEYKRLIVNGSVKTPRRLVIPQTTREKYSALYSALNDDNGGSRVQPKFASYTETNNDGETKPAFHKVKKGETLADIADNYGVTVQDLKVWNDLHRNRVSRGTLLRLTEPSAQAEQTGHRHSEHKYITYKVRRGDTISTIADKFDGTSVEKIKELNRLKNTRLQPGMTLKINHV